MGLNNLILLAEDTTIGEAGLNTLMGISIVFLSLAFISFVISLFKFFNREKKKPVNEPIIEATPVAVDEETEDLSNDEELVAVITAAIYSFEAEQGYDIPADGLFVRSIRKIERHKMA